MQYIIALLSIILGTVAQFLLKVGVTAVHEKSKNTIELIKNGLFNSYLWAGLCFYGISLVLWLFVLSKMELSKAYPLVSLGYIFTLVLAHSFLDEPITIAKVSGICLIIIGVIFLNR